MTEIRPGAHLELRVDRLSLGGDGVGRAGPCVVFVPYGCPGDVLQIEITEAHTNYVRGRIVSVVTPSPQRIKPPCPYHYQAPLASRPSPIGSYCGGCDWQHVTYAAQLEAKRHLVQETLERIGGLRGVEVKPTLGMKDPWRYRNKVQQPVGWDGHRVISGFYAPYSHRIVPIEDCLVQSELSVRVLNRVRALLEQYHLHPYDEKRHSGWIRHLWIRTMQANQALLVLVTRTEEFPRGRALTETLVREFPELVGIHQNVNPGKTNVILGRHWVKLCGADVLEEKLGPLRFLLSPGSFFQVNSLQTEVLYNKVKELAGKGEGLLDLYCGIGGMALWLAGNYEQVVGVDEVKSAIADAQQNARLNRITNAHFLAEPAEEFITGFRHPNPSRDLTVVLDPPRVGCAPQVLKALIHLKPRNLIYVSCDPGTLARDLGFLNKSNFRIKDVIPIDLFPHTSHIETVVRLTLDR